MLDCRRFLLCISTKAIGKCQRIAHKFIKSSPVAILSWSGLCWIWSLFPGISGHKAGIQPRKDANLLKGTHTRLRKLENTVETFVDMGRKWVTCTDGNTSLGSNQGLWCCEAAILPANDQHALAVLLYVVWAPGCSVNSHCNHTAHISDALITLEDWVEHFACFLMVLGNIQLWHRTNRQPRNVCVASVDGRSVMPWKDWSCYLGAR